MQLKRMCARRHRRGALQLDGVDKGVVEIQHEDQPCVGSIEGEGPSCRWWPFRARSCIMSRRDERGEQAKRAGEHSSAGFITVSVAPDYRGVYLGR